LVAFQPAATTLAQIENQDKREREIILHPVESVSNRQHPGRRMCIVVGAPGEAEFGAQFVTWSEAWKALEKSASLAWIGRADAVEGQLSETISEPASASDKERLLDWIAKDSESHAEHWIVLMGHGTHDPASTKFNLRGPDITAEEIAKAIDGKAGTWIVIVCASSSGPFLSKLSGPNRVVITATKSGAEQNFSRFGKYLSEAIADPDSDLDHDRSLSVLEAFLAASDRVSKYYRDEGLLATEQALLDDNGDGRGTVASFFRGVRAVKAPADGAKLDGSLARRIPLVSSESQLWWNAANRQLLLQLEAQVEELRSRKSQMSEDTYYSELETILRQLADIIHGKDGIVEP
jgi:hypothetical protein